MRYRIPVVVLATVAVVGYGCVQGKVLTDPADTRQGTDTTTTDAVVSLLVINPTTVAGTVGQSTALTATAQNQGGHALKNTSFTWASSNTQVASVDSTGMVTLVGVGSAKISVSAGGLTTSVPATATAAVVRVAAISVTPSSVTLSPTNISQLNAVLTDSAGNVLTGFAVTWSSSNTSVATVSSSGLLTAVAVGSAVITASSNGKTATTNVSVVAQSPATVASVTIAPASSSVTTGQTTQLTATVKDSVGNVLGGRAVAWSSSNTGVATVSSTGLVTGVASGTATISAASGGQQGTATVTVNPVPIASVVVTPTSANLSAHQTLLLSATVKDANGNVVTGQPISWSSDNTGVATVMSDGVVTAVSTTGAGSSCWITAVVGGKSGSAHIIIVNAPVATVEMSPTSVSLAGAGKTAQLTATAKDAYGDVITGDATSWSSSNTGVATVSSSGVVTSVAAGSATISVSIGGVAATASVTVTPAAVASVTVSPTSVSVTAGQSSPLTATAKDANGNVITGLAQTWTSSNSGVATVSSSGVVKGAAAGSATITVAIGGKNATAGATVTASTQTVASVAVSPTTSSLQVGNQVQLTATDKTSGGTVVTGQTVTWASSNTSVATVASNGIVTAVAAGGATITATSDGMQGSASLTVSAASGGGPYHEPAGMTAQINTGAMSVAPSQTSGGQWTEGVTTFTNFSPNSMSSTGEWSGNISATPDGTGIRVTYQPSLDGGNSPVRFGSGFASSGTGYLYIRWKFRLSPNWTLSQANGIKVMEPRTVNSTENHVVNLGAYNGATNGSNMWSSFLLQFMNGGTTNGYVVPGNSYGQADLTTYFSSSAANIGGAGLGEWHQMELYCQPESPAGAGNGQLTLWVDGVQVYQTGPGVAGTPAGGMHFFQSGESMGWNYLMFDPTYGGDQATDHPPTTIYWDIDQLYVSTK